MSLFTELPEEFYARDPFQGFSPTEAFSVANARTMMWLCQLAYEGSPQKIDRIRVQWGIASVKQVFGAISTEIAIQDTAAVVAASSTAVVVAFAGTDPLKLANWVTNFSLDPLPNQTHRGFQDAADAVWARLRAAIEAALAAHPAARLFFTGHSLGGALAVLSAEKAAQDNFIVSAVYTFGMPRVGTAAYQARYGGLAGRTYRLRFGRDVVPGVPTSEQGYQHVGGYFHCPVGKFADVPLISMQPSDEPAVVRDLLEEVRALLRRPPVVLPFLTRARMLLPSFFSPAPQTRPDLLGLMLEQLPPALRDHLPHRYLGAL